jgi:hypothetical protein
MLEVSWRFGSEYCIGMKRTNPVERGENTCKPKDEFGSGEKVSVSDDVLAGAVLIRKIPHKVLLRPK